MRLKNVVDYPFEPASLVKMSFSVWRDTSSQQLEFVPSVKFSIVLAHNSPTDL